MGREMMGEFMLGLRLAGVISLIAVQLHDASGCLLYYCFP
jgi:hypothetical protein